MTVENGVPPSSPLPCNILNRAAQHQEVSGTTIGESNNFSDQMGALDSKDMAARAAPSKTRCTHDCIFIRENSFDRRQFIQGFHQANAAS